jgi:hypothetical protein
MIKRIQSLSQLSVRAAQLDRVGSKAREGKQSLHLALVERARFVVDDAKRSNANPSESITGAPA